jgi:predicted deacetylase
MLGICLFLFPAVSSAQSSLKFVIRVDDILSRNTSILPRSIVPFQDSVEVRNGKITWGVMPHRFLETPNLDGKLANELTQSAQNGHELSLHGWLHICQRCNQSSHEFYCTTQKTAFTFEQQHKLISDGISKMIEETGVRPVSFIPPGHISDTTTWNVLRHNGIYHLSTTEPADFVTDSVFNIGMDNEFAWALTASTYGKNLTDALADIREKADEKGYYVMMFHDPFIRSGYENGITLRWTGELLDSLKAEYGSGLEIITLSELISETKSLQTSTEPIRETTVPEKEISLLQNYPNPFNPTTEIRFTLGKTTYAELVIIDIQGRIVETLVQQVLSSGTHQFTWNAENWSSGTYLYQLRTPERTVSKTLTLIK